MAAAFAAAAAALAEAAVYAAQAASGFRLGFGSGLASTAVAWLELGFGIDMKPEDRLSIASREWGGAGRGGVVFGAGLA